MDKHLNLFYTYKTHHLEDNVTRALVVMLQQLSPLHLRLLLVTLLQSSKHPISTRLSKPEHLLDPSQMKFELQVSVRDEDEKLSHEQGVLLGISYSGNQQIQFDPDLSDEGRGRADATIEDDGTGSFLVIESKLSDGLYQEQLQRHHRTFFSTDTAPRLADVFVETNWDRIAAGLLQIRANTGDTKEQFLIDQFIDYADMLGLLDFRPFRKDDFCHADLRERKLKTLLFLAAHELQNDLGLKEYTGNSQFWFADIPYENAYWWIEPAYVVCYGLFGYAKEWRARQFRELIVSDRQAVRDILQCLRDRLDKKMDLVVKVNSLFRLNRFQVEICCLCDEHTFPDGFERFCDIVTDAELNSFERLDRRQIKTRFSKYIRREANAEGEAGDEFPKWKSDQPVLQYCYCDVGIHIPDELVIGKQRGDIIDLFRHLLMNLQQTMKELGERMK